MKKIEWLSRLNNYLRVTLSVGLIVIGVQSSYTQNVGFEVAAEHNVLFGDSIAGGGDKMMWIPSKGAIRAGGVFPNSEIWNIDSIGSYSAVFGAENYSNASYSAAFGLQNKVFASAGMTWGLNNVLHGSAGTAWGGSNEIRRDTIPSIVPKNNYVTVWGYKNKINGDLCTTWGIKNDIRGFSSTSWGSSNKVDSIETKYATVWGENNIVNGDLATAWGDDNEANGIRTVAWGTSNIVNPIGATAWGTSNRIEVEDAFNATVWGLNNIVEGNRATAYGSGNTASERDATAWGNNNEASGISSTAFGTSNESKGGASLAIGNGNTANGYATTTLGIYAKPIGQEIVMSGLPTPFTADYPLFVIGNGSLNLGDINNPIRSNAVVVSKSGRVGINKQLDLPIADLHIKSSEAYTGAPLPNRSTGGIVLEDADTDAYWQINIANGDLHFSRNNVIKARLLDDGTWEAKDFDETNVFSFRLNNKTAATQLSNVIVGENQEGEITIDERSLLKTNPEFISFDEDGNPQSIDYKQLYLLAINEIQEQDKKIKTQNQMLESHEERLALLEKLIKE